MAWLSTHKKRRKPVLLATHRFTLNERGWANFESRYDLFMNTAESIARKTGRWDLLSEFESIASDCLMRAAETYRQDGASFSTWSWNYNRLAKTKMMRLTRIVPRLASLYSYRDGSDLIDPNSGDPSEMIEIEAAS